ncbi:MAG TPA: hypothetical protein DD670_15715 [Planctomycetaceae bacterium]|nr:hypothetical protein [Planctomycetaceae bacterium]
MKRNLTRRRRRLTTESLEPRCMLSAISVAPGDQWDWDSANGDVDNNGYLSSGDIVYHGGAMHTYDETGFTSIQAAIDAANAGDTITVSPGAYMEDITVNKSLTLLGGSTNAADVVVYSTDQINGHAVTIMGAEVTIENMRFANAWTAVNYVGEDGVTSLDLNNVQMFDSEVGMHMSGGDALLTGCLVQGNGQGVEITGGVATITQSQFIDNMMGVYVEAGGSARIVDNPLGIAGSSYVGVNCWGGTLLLENTNMNDNANGVILSDWIDGTRPVVDMGQLPGSTNNFTGLGVSTGGNDFSNYLPPSEWEAPWGSAVWTWSTDPVLGIENAIVGPSGLPPVGHDMAAHGNLWFSTDPREIEKVIQHDRDDVMTRFVDYAVLSHLVVTTDSPVDEGSPVAIDVSFANDPQSHAVLIDWGDGANTSLTLEQGEWELAANHLYAASGQYTIQVTVTDQLGGALSETTAVTVGGGTPVNEPPAVTVDSGLVSVAEGTIALNGGTFADPNLGDDVTIGASIGAVTKTGTAAGEWTWSWDATDDPLAAVVTITADDGQGGVATATFDLNVENVAPTLVAANMSVEENSPNGTLVGTVQATDPGDDVLTFSIVGGDGATAFAVDPETGEITVADWTQLDFEYVASYELIVQVADEDGSTDTAEITVELVNRPSITGAVFVDVNQNGLYDANESAVDGVLVELLDEFGSPVLDNLGDPITAVTEGGFYLFEDLPAGTYQIREDQPTGLNDGPEILGTLGGAIAANDVMRVTLATTDAHDYFFAEIGQQVTDGDTASVSFWNSQNGRNLLIAAGTDLTEWLTTNFSNVFGNLFADADGNMVHQFFQHQLFRQRGILSRIVNHVDTQFMALVLANYFTRSDLGGDLGAAYGFGVTDTGIATKVVNVGICGAAFGVANGTNLTIWQLLQATNSMTDVPDNQTGYAHIYDVNGNGQLSLSELLLRTQAQLVFTLILLQG